MLGSTQEKWGEIVTTFRNALMGLRAEAATQGCKVGQGGAKVGKSHPLPLPGLSRLCQPFINTGPKPGP